MVENADSDLEERPFIRRIGNNIRKSVGRLKKSSDHNSEVAVDAPEATTLDKWKKTRCPIEEDCNPGPGRPPVKRAQDVEQPFLRRATNRLRKSARNLRRRLGLENNLENTENEARSSRKRRPTRVFGCIRRNSLVTEEVETYQMPKIEKPKRDPIELRKERVDAIYAKYGARRIPGAASSARPTPQAEALEKLDERTDKLNEVERVTDDLESDAQAFSSTARQLAEKYKNEDPGKWYEFWKL